MITKSKATLKKIFNLKRYQQAGLTVATAAGSAAVLYAVYPPVLVAATMFVLIVHEFGHYFAAIDVTDAALPLFIPAIVFVLGMTMVMPLLDKEKMVRIYKAGPKWGLIASVIVAIVGAVVNNTMVIGSGIALACCEIYSMTLGSDGRRIRNAQASTE